MKNYQNNPEKLYREKVKMKDQFWAKITSDYISSLNTSSYRKNKSQGKYSRFIPEVGGVVSIRDHETKLGGKLAVIVRLVPSADGIIRQVEIKTTVPSPNIDINKNLRTVNKIKAISQLIPLELKAELPQQLTPDQILEYTNSSSKEPEQNSQTESRQNLDIPQGSQIETVQTDQENPNDDDSVNLNQSKTQEDTRITCGLPNCLKPTPPAGRVIKWVRCDKRDCKVWCHYDCAGIPYIKEFSKKDVYLCPLCVEKLNNEPEASSNLDTNQNNGESSKTPIRRSNRKEAGTKFKHFLAEYKKS